MNELLAVDHLQIRQFELEWFLGLRCNYDCSYCGSHDNVSKHTDILLLMNIADQLVKNFGNNIHVWFSGGEPTVHPKFHELISYLYKLGVTDTGVTTNGTRPIEYYIALYDYIHGITFSTHFEYLKNYDDFLKKISELNIIAKKKKKIFTINIMLYPGKLDIVKQIQKQCDDENISYNIRKIRFKTSDVTNSDEELAFLNNLKTVSSVNNIKVSTKNGILHMNVNDLLAREKNKFKGWLCSIGINFMQIDSDGKIYKGVCKVGGEIGNIKTGFSKPNGLTVCTKNSCNCATDLSLPKIKSMDQFDFIKDSLLGKIK